jgi:hypothetical protein
VEMRSSDSRIANGATRRNLEVYSAQRFKDVTDRLYQVFAGLGSLAKFAFEDFPRFLLHRSPVLSRTNPQLAFGVFRQLANCYAGHAINDITAINDCTSAVALKPRRFIRFGVAHLFFSLVWQTSPAVLIAFFLRVAIESQLNQAADEFRIAYAGGRPQLGIHADRSESRHGIDFVQIYFARLGIH